MFVNISSVITIFIVASIQKQFRWEIQNTLKTLCFNQIDILRSEDKAVEQLVSGEIEMSVIENNAVENLMAGPSNSPKLHSGNLDENTTSLRQESLSELRKMLAENQKEMLKFIVPSAKQ